MSDTLMDVMPLATRGYCCSQIMAIMMLKERGRDNPDLVRAVAGLCRGIADSGETCGVLFGGVCLVSLFLAKGSDDETPNANLPFAIYELVQWFNKETQGTYGGRKCSDILAVSPDKKACLKLIVGTYEKVLSILKACGVRPEDGSK